MFGTTMLIKTHHEKSGAKSKTHVKIFRADDIKRHCGLDQDGFVLFALLAGGDYEVKGLPGCGPKTALKLAQSGLGQALRHASLPEMYAWRKQLEFALRGKCDVPFDFPNMRALKYYTNPTVSNQEQLHKLRGLQKGWDMPLKETELRTFLGTHYNIQIKGYQKHILPILLMRTLCATNAGLERTNNIYGIQLARTRKNKSEDEDCLRLERKITFLPQPVTALDLSRQPEGPEGEDWTQLADKNGIAFDATARIDCEILAYVLERGVPHVLQKAAEEPAKQLSSKKRKGTRDEELLSSSSKQSSELKAQSSQTDTNDDSKPKVRWRKRAKRSSEEYSEGSRPPLQVADANAKSRPTFRKPPAFDMGEEPEALSSKNEVALGLSSTNENDISATIMKSAGPENMPLGLMLAQQNLDQSKHESPEGHREAAQTIRYAEPDPAEMRARRLAHFERTVGAYCGRSGFSIADAIELD